ncbi:hypothetical protein HAZT_HAZT008770, partial [Hyalella azteca]
MVTPRRLLRRALLVIASAVAPEALLNLAEPIRTLLTYTGTQYEDKTYDIGPAPAYDRSEWFNVKFSLGLDLPNVGVTEKIQQKISLPYYIDGDVKLTESSAIIRHLGRKTGLAGATEQEKMRID